MRMKMTCLMNQLHSASRRRTAIPFLACLLAGALWWPAGAQAQTTNHAPQAGFGTALQFDGVNDCVLLPAALAATIGGTDALTIEYWFKGTQLQSPVRFQDGGGYIVAGWSATAPQHTISTDGGTASGLSVGAESIVENGQWHHLAMTWQRNTTNGFKSQRPPAKPVA